jgi:hypothetical protein
MGYEYGAESQAGFRIPKAKRDRFREQLIAEIANDPWVSKKAGWRQKSLRWLLDEYDWVATSDPASGDIVALALEYNKHSDYTVVESALVGCAVAGSELLFEGEDGCTQVIRYHAASLTYLRTQVSYLDAGEQVVILHDTEIASLLETLPPTADTLKAKLIAVIPTSE